MLFFKKMIISIVFFEIGLGAYLMLNTPIVEAISSTMIISKTKWRLRSLKEAAIKQNKTYVSIRNSSPVFFLLFFFKKTGLEFSVIHSSNGSVHVDVVRVLSFRRLE